MGTLEILIGVSTMIAAIWVYFDAPKQGINKILAMIGVIMLIFPIGFLAYLAVTRLIKLKKI